MLDPKKRITFKQIKPKMLLCHLQYGFEATDIDCLQGIINVERGTIIVKLDLINFEISIDTTH